MFSHFDDFTGMNDSETLTFFRAVLLQDLSYLRFITDKNNIIVIRFDGVDRTENNLLRRVIAPHSIYSYFHTLPTPINLKTL